MVHTASQVKCCPYRASTDVEHVQGMLAQADVYANSDVKVITADDCADAALRRAG